MFALEKKNPSYNLRDAYSAIPVNKRDKYSP